MEIKEIKELMTAFTKADLSSLSLKCEAFELDLKKELTGVVTPVQSVIRPSVQENDNTAETTHLVDSTMEPSSKPPIKTIVSPMVGTFYAASNPQAEPLVKVGDIIKKGDIVCVIEAMKLMNEVESEVEGEVIEVLVKNEEMVEYNQPLFVLK